MITLNKDFLFICSMVLCVVLTGLILFAFPNTNTPLEQAETPPQLQVMDKQLLTPEQRETVLKTDSVAFKRGNEWVVITHGARAALKGYY